MWNMNLILPCVILVTYFNIGQHKELGQNKDYCGVVSKKKQIESYIMGGILAKYMQFPWIVVLMQKKTDDWQQVCGATLINSKYVVTAAHCFYTLDGQLVSFDKFQVLLGVSNWKIKEPQRQAQPLQKVIIHEKYDWDNKLNDISLIKLCTPINFKKSQIRPICLPEKNDKDNLYKGKGLTAGWGTSDMKYPEKLKYAALTIGSKRACIQQLKEREFHKFLFETTICTITPDDGKDICGGDSGGPLMGINKKNGKAYLRGIVSFGCFICAGFGGYSKVSYFLNWIHKNSYL